jgi:hypothetical protein
MKAKEFVNSLFEGYEETTTLSDFKEELLGNLNAKIENLVKKGMDMETAFAKASTELGDVSALANELSLKKRTEVFEEVYMDIKQYMNPKRVTAYVVFGALALFGITAAFITLFATKGNSFMAETSLYLTTFFATMLPFLTAAVAGFTFLGVTQETASDYPVSKKRGTWYAAAAGLITFGILTMPVVFFSVRMAHNNFHHIIPVMNFETLVPVISLMIPFVLPGIGILVFLVLTEKNRQKPWAKDLHNKAMKEGMEMWNDPVTAGRFGMFSGAIWIFAIGLFIMLGFLIGFKFSWLVFVFAVAFQLMIQGFMFKSASKNSMKTN